MARGAEVLVAGAGALGLTTALALADAGCRVTVCDPALMGVGASGVAAGLLAPVTEAALDEEARPHFHQLLAGRDLWPGLEARIGLVVDRTGSLAVGDGAWLAALARGMAGLGVHGALIGGATARALTPGLSEAFDIALLCREDWRFHTGAALVALRRAGEAAGVTFEARKVDGRKSADVLVVATGASRSGLAPELASLSAIKGHIVRVKTDLPAGAVIRAQVGYAASAGGRLAVGATMEAGVEDPAVDPAKGEPLLDLAARLFPGLANSPYTLSAGIRATTPDGLPMVGASTEPGVMLAAGARRNGWLLAPQVARIVTAHVTGADPGPYAPRMDPRRFSSP